MEEYADRRDVESATVLHGVLNLVEWNTIRANPAIRYYLFEDLCLDPLGAFEKIFSELDLPYTAATRHRHEKLCFAGSAEPGDYRTHAVARNSRAMADSWKKLLNPDQLARIRRIWERFDIPLYRRDEEWLV